LLWDFALRLLALGLLFFGCGRLFKGKRISEWKRNAEGKMNAEGELLASLRVETLRELKREHGTV
jgi:hypothetical protein